MAAAKQGFALHPSTLILATLMIWISVVDFQRYQIPNLASALLVVLGILFAIPVGMEGLGLKVFAGVFWCGIIWATSALYAWIRNRRGLGFGDVKLMVGIGVWVGLAGAANVLLFASLSGIAAILTRAVITGQSKSEIGVNAIAFGPFLCFCAYVEFLTGAGL